MSDAITTARVHVHDVGGRLHVRWDTRDHGRLQGHVPPALRLQLQQRHAGVERATSSPRAPARVGRPPRRARSRITDEILATPGLYVVLLGDLVQMAIKLRNVAEVSSNLLPPDLQVAYLDSWLAEIEPRVICATWGNHEERQETQAGVSVTRHVLAKRVPYSDGIAHVDIRVGRQVYKFALSHVFRGRSIYNRTHGAGRYLRLEAQDREIAMAGDSHEPGFALYYEGGRLRCALNGGSIQASGYMKRHFALSSHPSYPGVALYPDEHRFQPFHTVGDWLAARRVAA